MDGLCWDGDILLSTGVMIVGMVRDLSHRVMESCSREGGGGVELKCWY